MDKFNVTEEVLQKHATVQDVNIAFNEREINGKILCLASSFDSESFKLVNSILNDNSLLKTVEKNIIINNINDELQVFSLVNLGANGKEGTIKNSMIEVVDCLNELDNNDNIIWSSVTNVFIDNVDDLYSYVITFVLKK